MAGILQVATSALAQILFPKLPDLHRTALQPFALEASMEVFLILQNGVREQYLVAYYLLV